MSNPIWHLGAVLVAASVVAAAPRPMATVPASAGGPPDTLVVVPSASSIRWRATSGGGRVTHEGTVAPAGGLFVLRHEMLTSGTFTANMERIAVTSVPASWPAARRLTDARLAGTGLFEVKRFPTATFTTIGMQRIGPSRWRMEGELTLHGVTRPLSFDADVRWAELGHVVATSSFAISRRDWHVGPNLTASVDDTMHVSVTLDARRKVKEVAGR